MQSARALPCAWDALIPYAPPPLGKLSKRKSPKPSLAVVARDLPPWDRVTLAPSMHSTTPPTFALTLPPTKQVSHRSKPRYQTRGLVASLGRSVLSPSFSAFCFMAASSSFTVSKTFVGQPCWQRG